MLPVEAAAIWSLLAGYLLLPSGTQVDLPLLPPIDKASIAAVSALLLCWLKGFRSGPKIRSPWAYLLVAAFVLSPILTSLENSYELQIPGGSIPGFYPLDGLKYAGRNLIEIIPLYIGARLLWTDESKILLLKCVPVAALFYSLPMLLEVRLSPQLHAWVYGYYPQSFNMTVRNGGFRPVVFLTNGLQVALFASMATIAAVIAVRAKWRIFNFSAAAVSSYLGFILILCKSLGSALYAAVLTPLVLFTRPRLWARIACVVMCLICAYPMLRWHGIIPVHHLSEVATTVSLDRSESLKTRVQNEDQLLAKANEKPMLGWGAWGRNRVYDRYTGRDISLTDGRWIIQYGTFGWLGYLSLFGLLTLAAFRAARSLSDQITPANIAVGGLSLLLATNMIDLLPNSSLSPITFLIAGSMLSATRVRRAAGPGLVRGRAELVRSAESEQRAITPQIPKTRRPGIAFKTENTDF